MIVGVARAVGGGERGARRLAGPVRVVGSFGNPSVQRPGPVIQLEQRVSQRTRERVAQRTTRAEQRTGAAGLAVGGGSGPELERGSGVRHGERRLAAPCQPVEQRDDAARVHARDCIEDVEKDEQQCLPPEHLAVVQHAQEQDKGQREEEDLTAHQPAVQVHLATHSQARRTADAHKVEGRRADDGAGADGRMVEEDADDGGEDDRPVAPRSHERRAGDVVGYAAPFAQDIQRGH